VLKWLHNTGCPWDGLTCAAPLGAGTWLKWAREHDCPWDTSTRVYAAWDGHLEVLKWGAGERLPEQAGGAAPGNHPQTLAWVRAQPQDQGRTSHTHTIYRRDDIS
jgi:hypothetical protein